MRDAFEDEQESGPKGLSAKLLVSTIYGVKIDNFKTFYSMYASKLPVTLQTALLALIIVHLQIHPSLHLPISTIIQCIFKIFQIIVDFKKIVYFFFLHFFQIQIYKYQNCPTSVKICIQFYLIK